MKYLLAPLVVAFIITSSSLVTAQQKNITCSVANQTTIVTTGEIIAKLHETQSNQLKSELCREFANILAEVAFKILNVTSTSGEQCVGTAENNTATSCKEIYACNSTAPSGYYWINTTTGPLQVYCQMEFPNFTGDPARGWMRAAYINMTENTTCPQGLNDTNVSYSGDNYQVCPSNHYRLCPNRITKHMCIRSHTDKYNCSSVTFKTHGIPYTKVRGQARGYQYRYTPAFRGSHFDGKGYRYARSLTPDDTYVSGLSVTYGSPRQHIWTFAAGWSKNYSYTTTNCPCAKYPGPAAPKFVRENYFCESGNEGRVERMRWHFNDTLWDSNGCVSKSTTSCCDPSVFQPFRPWFDTRLRDETSDDIEVRMCHYFDSRTEIIGVELLEIYIY